MPRKGPTAPRRTSSLPRRPAVTFYKATGDDDNIDDNEGEDGEDEVDEQNVVEMLAMLQEFQKRKASKTSVRSAAFQSHKGVIFADARKRASDAVRDGATSIEKARATILDLKAQEISQEAALISLKALLECQDECVHGLLSSCNGVIEDLAHRRAEHINEASAMQSQVTEREESRKRLVAHARNSIEDNIEHQKVATDANALIKHFKALIRS
ncbi:hypothetical protein BN946_scf185014.g83 [Trametes cinnabarina]|uniref:Uncharacterized protein n=1 Tax=Pycnoporus cinnabarinus TaxID=5643 RepID=A0A060SMG0_PYCCI|nr:hypothetical protein BN946_scf185014.g83 [Trametes cinnabarina]